MAGLLRPTVVAIARAYVAGFASAIRLFAMGQFATGVACGPGSPGFQRDINDPAAVSAMTDYYRVVAPAASGTFDARKGAVWELQWWRQRRESAPPAEWAGTIATVTALLYGCSAEQALPVTQARTQPVVYRDARRKTGLTAGEWREVEVQLCIAYHLLKVQVTLSKLDSSSTASGKLLSATPSKTCSRTL